MKAQITAFLAGLLLVVNMVVPVASAEANRTERIPLRYYSASEAQKVFVPTPVKEGGGGLGNRDERGPLPAGIVALGVDAQGSALLATGTRKGLAELRKIIRLLDIPPRAVRLSVTAITPDAKLRESVGVVATRTVGSANPDALLRVDVFEQQPKTLIEEARKRGGISLETELTAAGNREAYFFIPSSDGKGRRFSVQPRVNGDRSVTLLFGEVNAASFSIRRVSSGAHVLLMPDESLALLIRVETSAKKR